MYVINDHDHFGGRYLKYFSVKNAFVHVKQKNQAGKQFGMMRDISTEQPKSPNIFLATTTKLFKSKKYSSSIKLKYLVVRLQCGSWLVYSSEDDNQFTVISQKFFNIFLIFEDVWKKYVESTHFVHVCEKRPHPISNLQIIVVTYRAFAVGSSVNSSFPLGFALGIAGI